MKTVDTLSLLPTHPGAPQGERQSTLCQIQWHIITVQECTACTCVHVRLSVCATAQQKKQLPRRIGHICPGPFNSWSPQLPFFPHMKGQCVSTHLCVCVYVGHERERQQQASQGNIQCLVNQRCTMHAWNRTNCMCVCGRGTHVYFQAALTSVHTYGVHIYIYVCVYIYSSLQNYNIFT